GPKPEADGSGRAAIATFTVEGVHAQGLSTFLDQSGVAIRSGHHCTEPLHKILGVDSTPELACTFTTPLPKSIHLSPRCKKLLTSLAISSIKAS
ncbi:MAG: aminotransferase class V-fold PLP-dependent enzyme, partial [Phormidesmis sp.]